jgi:hypothetical protein
MGDRVIWTFSCLQMVGRVDELDGLRLGEHLGLTGSGIMYDSLSPWVVRGVYWTRMHICRL